ncbi:MAG: hypothetical protein ACYC3K_04795 [Candidatus Nanopelagicales bacterium]
MTCPTGKRTFDTRAQARALRKRHPDAPRRAYYCHACTGWHLGRLSRPVKHGTATDQQAP